jgi:hypothetical protein
MHKIILGTAVLAVTACGCRVIQPESPKNINQANVMVLGSKFAESFANDNAEEFLECLSPQVRQSINEEKFKTSYAEIIDKFGKVESCEFMGNLENPLYQIQIWKMRFEKDNRANEMLFRILMAETDGNMQVVSFAFL